MKPWVIWEHFMSFFNCKSTLCTAQSMCNQKEVFFFPSLAVLFPGNFQVSECLFTLTQIMPELSSIPDVAAGRGDTNK